MPLWLFFRRATPFGFVLYLYVGSGNLSACAGKEFAGRSETESSGGGSGTESSSGGHSAGSGGRTPEAGGAGELGGHAGGTADTSSMQCPELHDDLANFHVEICVPKSTFTMGSDAASITTGSHANHSPRHEVTLSTYQIDAYEVTVGRYRSCVNAGACTRPVLNTTKGCTYSEPENGTESLPVSCVTAGQAAIFCQWDDGRRLPTEAEWERAAASTDANVYPWGDDFDCSKAAIDSLGSCVNRYSEPSNVGTFVSGKSAIGAFDMTGNVAEWVKDISGDYPDEPTLDPLGALAGPLRIVRGGSYLSPAADGQTFARVALGGSTTSAIGFRCARSAAP